MSKRKLLLADDSVTIQKVVNLTFADEGVEVISVGNGDAAIERISESRPDVVLADVNMPGLSGYEICELLRGDEATRNIPVLLLVGSFEPFDEEEATRVGADGHLTKPFQSIRQLVTRVSELMERAESMRNGEATQEIDVGPWEPVSDEPETLDIENLYNDSLGETIRITDFEPEKPPFDDDGIDDEMIETSYVENVGDSEPHEKLTFSPFDEPVEEYEPAGAPTGHAFEQAYEDPGGSEASEPSQFDRGQTPADSDLLELPPVGTPYTIGSAPSGEASLTGHTHTIVSLSPELIDAIVDRVLERMAERK